MTEAQFEAIAKLIRSKTAAPAAQAARLVLVHHKSNAEASRATGASPATIYTTVRRYRNADNLIRQAYGLAEP